MEHSNNMFSVIGAFILHERFLVMYSKGFRFGRAKSRVPLAYEATSYL